MYRKNIIFGIFLFMFIGCSEPKEEHAVISFMIGNVEKNKVEAHIGDIVKKDDIIETGVNSFCDLKIGDSLIRVKAKSNLTVSSLLDFKGNDNIVLGLSTGKMLCKPKKLLKSERFIVKTATAVAGVRGTQFSVEADRLKTTRIKVFKGKVKVAKRIKQLESKVDEVLKLSTGLQKEEKVIITAKEVAKAEKSVEKSLKRETAYGGSETNVLQDVVEQNLKIITVQRGDVEKFAPSDFARENQEIIAVTEKPKKVIVRLKKVIKKTIEKPVPLGRLVVTEYDVYFIKSGKIEWEGKLLGKPLRLGSRLYVSSEDHIFCAETSGPVLWKKNIINDGKIKVNEGKVWVKSGKEEISLDAGTGKRL